MLCRASRGREGSHHEKEAGKVSESSGSFCRIKGGRRTPACSLSERSRRRLQQGGSAVNSASKRKAQPWYVTRNYYLIRLSENVPSVFLSDGSSEMDLKMLLRVRVDELESVIS